MNTDYWKEIDKDSNMFDFTGFYSRMAQQLPDNCIIAEIGLSNGKSMLYLASQLAALGKKFTMYAIDNMDYGGDFRENTIREHIKNAGMQDCITLVRADSLNASLQFPDSHFDFVYIDASHQYEATKAEVRLWLHKIKNGCILAGHDAAYIEVKNAVSEVLAPLNITPTFEDTDHNWGLWWFMKVE